MNEGFSRTVRGATFIAQKPSRFATKERISRTRKISSGPGLVKRNFFRRFCCCLILFDANGA
jgi:hypothetical protein